MERKQNHLKRCNLSNLQFSVLQPSSTLQLGQHIQHFLHDRLHTTVQRCITTSAATPKETPEKNKFNIFLTVDSYSHPAHSIYSNDSMPVTNRNEAKEHREKVRECSLRGCVEGRRSGKVPSPASFRSLVEKILFGIWSKSIDPPLNRPT
jgi:hypothetical protein